MAAAFGLMWAALVVAAGMVANVSSSAVVALYAVKPAQAAALWLASTVLVNGLGGGNEIIGGLWLLLVSCAAWQAPGWPRGLAGFGGLVAAAGLLTAVLPWSVLGEAFGLGSVAWFAWLGVWLLRAPGALPTRP